MATGNSKVWLSLWVLLDKGLQQHKVNDWLPGAIKKQDDFLLTVLKPLVDNNLGELFDKFIYTRYPIKESVPAIPRFEPPLINYIIIRFYLLSNRSDDMKDVINRSLNDNSRSPGLYIDYEWHNDWGKDVNMNKCYWLYGGVGVYDLVDDFLYQISKINLQLLERELNSDVKLPVDPDGKSFRYAKINEVSCQWAHILYNQMCVQSRALLPAHFQFHIPGVDVFDLLTWWPR